MHNELLYNEECHLRTLQLHHRYTLHYYHQLYLHQYLIYNIMQILPNDVDKYHTKSIVGSYF